MHYRVNGSSHRVNFIVDIYSTPAEKGIDSAVREQNAWRDRPVSPEIRCGDNSLAAGLGGKPGSPSA
jgi:hypothetical protein